MKKCNICQDTKKSSEFHKNGLTKDGLATQCKRCHGQQSRRRKQEKKRKLINALGGKCYRCGYDKCPAALQFHHNDDNKENEVSSLLRHKFETALSEAQKCILLCANCHAEEHWEGAGPVLGKRR